MSILFFKCFNIYYFIKVPITDPIKKCDIEHASRVMVIIFICFSLFYSGTIHSDLDQSSLVLPCPFLYSLLLPFFSGRNFFLVDRESHFQENLTWIMIRHSFFTWLTRYWQTFIEHTFSISVLSIMTWNRSEDYVFLLNSRYWFLRATGDIEYFNQLSVPTHEKVFSSSSKNNMALI